MINSITGWTKSIILAVIIATIIQMILPEGKNKKYIKTVIGLYILFTIISPIISKFTGENIELDTSKYKQYFNTQNYTQASTNTIDTSLDSTYISSIKSNIKQSMKEKGYIVNSIDVDVELKNEERYGTINSLKLSLSKDKTETNNSNIETVQKVEINVSNKQEENVSVLTDLEKREVKEYLINTYGISKNKIEIN